MNEVYPVNFKVAYAFAAIPARYALERKDWKQAAALKIHPLNFPWDKFPWQNAIIHFARAMGHVHLNNINAAEKELDTLKTAYEKLKDQKNKALEATQVAVQIKAAEGWIEYKKGDHEKAIMLMKAAADAEDATEKHPVTPGPVIPARELLGELLLEMDQPALALTAFEQDLKRHPNRQNGLIGLTMANKKANK
jgi:tetratricopeptide (TPR) repeat protein